MTQGVTYIDAMDTTRFLRPIAVHKSNTSTQVMCRVYWKIGREAPQFGGATLLPRNMFSTIPPIESVEDIARLHQNDRCGFLPVVTIEAPRKQELPDAPGFERNDDEEFYDD